MAENRREMSEHTKREEKVLAFWKEREIFRKSLIKEAPKGDFIFYEGPPTANGRPGIHHLEARAFKDVILRFKTMQGYFVRRKGGWDTHGLPVELQVEKELGLSSKKEIETYGIAKFNKKCKESVWRYIDEWKKFTDRIGFWVDLKHPYVTYENSYIESVWHIVRVIFEKGLIYKDYKVVPWCPRCGTGLSSHELAQGYQDVKDLSVTAKFKIKGEENTYFLAWTTTPWTLPGNVALAVGKDIEYVKIKSNIEAVFSGTETGEYKEEYYILAKNIFYKDFHEEGSSSTRYFKDRSEQTYDLVEELHGKDLAGMSYEPVYDFIASKKDIKNLENAWKVYAADFVTTEEGTGIVHTAVMYGQDDFELGTKVGLPKYHLVNEDGTFTEATGFLKKTFVKDETTAVAIIKDLAGRNLLFKKEKYEHSYPHCWRCKTPLIYYARDSWYIRMSSLRDRLVKENEGINWEPTHIKEGRFGEWLRDVKDWAISRERYWGTPLPLWKNTKTNEYIAIGSVEELRQYVKTSGNTYHIMRHGESVFNTQNRLNSVVGTGNPLTDKGREQVKEAAARLKKSGIDIIFHSPLERTKETALLVAEELGLPNDALISDERLCEVSFGEFENKTIEGYHSYFEYSMERLTKQPHGGETWTEVKQRTTEFLYKIEEKYKEKRVLIISHNGPLQMLQAGAYGYEDELCAQCIEDDRLDLANAEVREVSFIPLPHDEAYKLDLHRPYIDAITLEKDGAELMRVSEVMDVWFDSGAMPYAQDHYPFENAKTLQPEKGFFRKQKGYPADYITEAIDQTRGWFYTLHAIGVLLGYGKAYKNVICLGHILDEDGKKMSKSLGNMVNPWDMIEKYGVDALRFWMYSVNQPGESKNFDERTVDEAVKKVFNLLINTLRFFSMHKNKSVKAGDDSTHLLDVWILSRLSFLVENTTQDLERYEVLRPAREMRDFIADLSQWYVRRSRERFKNEEERTEALQTLRYVLVTVAKVIAPFAPFVAEEMYQETKEKDDVESVHIATWPDPGKRDEAVLQTMKLVREVVSDGLQRRAKAGIKVRQPLASVVIQKNIPEAYQEFIKDELNIKEVIIDENSEVLTRLDTMVTDELEEEGNLRELIRAVQQLRKEKALQTTDKKILEVETDESGRNFIKKFESELMKTAGITSAVFVQSISGETVQIGSINYVFDLK